MRRVGGPNRVAASRDHRQRIRCRRGAPLAIGNPRQRPWHHLADDGRCGHRTWASYRFYRHHMHEVCRDVLDAAPAAVVTMRREGQPPAHHPAADAADATTVGGHRCRGGEVRGAWPVHPGAVTIHPPCMRPPTCTRIPTHNFTDPCHRWGMPLRRRHAGCMRRGWLGAIWRTDSGCLRCVGACAEIPNRRQLKPQRCPLGRVATQGWLKSKVRPGMGTCR